MAVDGGPLAHLQKQLAALPPRPKLAEVERAQQGIADVDRQLIEKLEKVFAQPPPDGVDKDSFRKVQALKEDAFKQSAAAERLKFQAVLDLEAKHQHYERLISHAESSMFGQEDEKESEAADLANREEARSEKLMRAIQEAHEQRAKSLDLSAGYQGSLTWLPESLGHLTELTDLDISGQQLQTIPDALAGLSKLRSLNLRSNKLHSLPDSLGLFTNLTSLNVASNSLGDLPLSLSNCSSLEVLDLNFNNLKALPASLFNNLPRLRRLSMHLNKLPSLPSSIGRLTALEELDAHFNEIQVVPDALGSCTKLRKLDLSSNFAYLGEIPDAMGDLTALERLDLRNNQLQELPLTFGRLTQLTTLLLDGNPLKEPPPEIVSKGAQAVVTYLASSQQRAAATGGYAWINGWLGGVAGLGFLEWLQSLFGGVNRMLTSSTGPWLLGWTQTRGPRRLEEPEGTKLEEL